MDMTNIIFLFLFLPVSLVLYYLVRNEVKEYVLMIISLIFYACGSLEYLVLFIISMSFNIVLGRKIHSTNDPKLIRKMLLICGIVLDAGVLVYYKYSGFAISALRGISKDFEIYNILAPLGISFFTFKEISYLADIYMGKAILDDNPVHDVLYFSFFAQIQSGPITRYNDMRPVKVTKEDDQNRQFDLFADGVYRFIIGFNKKILLANNLSNITRETFSASMADMSIGYAWLGAICFSLQLYYDFSGYSDMAIGITQMFGYRCPENFVYPYFTESVSKFWRRWHISLSAWFRDYIYFPLGGSRVDSKWRLILNLFVVWLLTGIWHGANWNFIIWGLGYFVLISFEKFTGIPDKFKLGISKAIYRILTLMFINFEWVIFNSDSLRDGLRYIKKMIICPSNPLADARTLFLIKDYFVFIICAVIFSFPVIPYIEKKMSVSRCKQYVWEMVYMGVNIFLFVWAISFVISGRNNPFVYANF